METLIVGVVIAMILLIAAPYMLWSAILLIPRLFWACSKVMTCLILLGIFAYGANMLIEHNAAKMEKKIENAPRTIIIEEN